MNKEISLRTESDPETGREVITMRYHPKFLDKGAIIYRNTTARTKDDPFYDLIKESLVNNLKESIFWFMSDYLKRKRKKHLNKKWSKLTPSSFEVVTI